TPFALSIRREGRPSSSIANAPNNLIRRTMNPQVNNCLFLPCLGPNRHRPNLTVNGSVRQSLAVSRCLTFVSRLISRMCNMGTEYQAYLLRLQRSQTARHWWVTLENAHTGEVCHFAS